MPGIYHDPKQEAQRVQDLQKNLSPGDDSNWLLNALGSDFQRNMGALISGLTAPATALSGGYNQREIDPNTGAVSPVDPRMVTDAGNMAALASTGSVGMVPADALGMGIKAFHGSPHSFDQFDMSKVGTGEGAQAFGHGLYFADREGVAKSYQDALTSGANNWSVDGKNLGSLSSSFDPADRLKYEIGIAARQGKTPEQAIDYVLQQKRGQLTSRHLAPEDIPVLNDDIATLQQMRSAPPEVLKNPGHMYAVDINAAPEHLLDFDAKFADQTPHVQAAVRKLFPETQPQLINNGDSYWVTRPWDPRSPRTEPVRGKAAGDALLAQVKAGAKLIPGGSLDAMTGADIYKALQNKGNRQLGVGTAANRSDAYASKLLNDAGIPGLKYLDANSRSAGDGTRNYVVFDDKHVNVERKYAKSGGTLNSEPDTALANIAQLKA